MTYIQLINHFWSLNHRQPVGGSEAAIYLYILSQYNLARRKGDTVEININMICYSLKMGRQTLCAKLKNLAKLGLIGLPGGRVTNVVVVKLPIPEVAKTIDKQSSKNESDQNCVRKEQNLSQQSHQNPAQNPAQILEEKTDENLIQNLGQNSASPLNKEYKERKEYKEKEKKRFSKNLLDKECNASPHTREGDKKNENAL